MRSVAIEVAYLIESFNVVLHAIHRLSVTTHNLWEQGTFYSITAEDHHDLGMQGASREQS